MRRRSLLGSLLACAGLAAGVFPLRALAQSAGSDGEDGFGPAEWIRIPSIEVDSHVSDVGVVDGYYDVPWFDIGHHADSHNPGELGNSVFNGHVVTINAGEVFRRLQELKPGDAVYAYTPEYRLDWVITRVFSVSQNDTSFLTDTDEPRITLYTCTGQFNPLERNYAERLVAVGVLVNTAVRADA